MSNVQRLTVGLAALLFGTSLTACSGGGTVATVNGQPISESAFNIKLEGTPMARTVLQQMVQDALIDQYAKNNNITVTDAEISAREDQIKQNFPAGSWDEMLKSRGLSEDDVHAALREQLILDKALGSQVKVAPAQIKDYFDKNRATFDKPEQVTARHILVPNLAEAQKVEQLLKSGQSFGDVAKQYSTDPGSKDKGGELGTFKKGQMVPAFDKVAFSAPVNAISAPVKSPFGYHIIQTEKKVAAGIKPLADVKDSIVQALEQQKQGAAEQQFAAQLTAEAQKNGLDKTAAAHGLHVVTTDYVAKDGVIGGLSDPAALLAGAFAADKGAAPAQASVGDGYAMFTVVDVKAARAPQFAEYKSHILDDYRTQKAPALLEQQTDKLDDRAKVLNDLKKAAAEMKVPFKTSDFVGQDGQVPDIGAMSGPASVAFSLPKGQISSAIDAEQAGVVLVVTDKQEPSADDIAKNFDQTREQLLSDQRDEIYHVFLGTLSKKYQDGNGIRMSQQAQTPGGIPGN